MQHPLEDLMRLALAATSGQPADLPVAAIILDGSGSVVASSRNSVQQTGDLSAHAEILAIRSLGLTSLKSEAESMTIVVTLEPCPMCAWAIRLARIRRLVFGAYNSQYGAAGSVYDLLRDGEYGRPVEVFGGILEEECKMVLDAAFSELRHNGGW